MKKLFLAITLFSLPFTASANIFKLPEEVLVCKDLTSIQLFEKARQDQSQEVFKEVVDYLVENGLCSTSIEAIVRVVDVSTPFVKVQGISTQGYAWMYSKDLK